MKPHQLRAFVALAEGGNLAKASQRLNKTAAAISKSIRELEATFNIELFNRTAKGMTLSDGGRVLLPRARAILAERTRADQELRMLREEQGALLRVGVTPAVSVLIAPELIERCLLRMPSIRLELHEYPRDQMAQRLDDGTLDLALHGVPSYLHQDPEQRDGLLYETELAVVARAGGPLSEARSLDDLRHAVWIYMDSRGHQQAYIDECFQSAGLEPPARFLVCSAAVLAMSMTLQMDAVAIVARPVADFYRGIAVLPVLPEPPSLSVYSLVRPSVAASALVEMFLSVARDALKNQAGRPLAIHRQASLQA